MGLRLIPSVVPASVIVLIPPAIGLEQRRTPGSRAGPRFFPIFVGVRAMVSVALEISRAVGTVVRILPRPQVDALFPVMVGVVMPGAVGQTIGVALVMAVAVIT